MSNNVFSYTRVFFVLFFFRKTFISISDLFSFFIFFLFREVLISFTFFSSEYFFWIIFIYYFLYMSEKKFSSLEFFSLEFHSIWIFSRISSSEFSSQSEFFSIWIFSDRVSSSESEEIYTSSIIYLWVFFL